MKQTRQNALRVNHHGRIARAALLLAAAALVAGLAACDMELSDEDERATLIAREKAKEEKKLMDAVTDACGVEPVYYCPLREESSVSIVGKGKFVDDNTFGTGKVFENDGTEVRTNYLLLPEDIFTHSKDTRAITIGFWVKGYNADPANDKWHPILGCYAEKKNPNDWNGVFICQSRGTMQINCEGWTNFDGTGGDHPTNDNGTNVESVVWLGDDEWHYYTVVVTETKCAVYNDGVVANSWTLDGSEGQVTAGLFDSGDKLKYNCLGGNQADSWNDTDLPTRFAKFAVWNKALTQAQIQALIAAK